MFLCYDCTLEWFYRMTLFYIFNDICQGISGSAVLNKTTGAMHQTLTIVWFLNGSNCDQRAIPNRACAKRSLESILKSRLLFQTKLNSTQSNYHHHLKYYCAFFSVNFIYFLTAFYSIFMGRKNGGFMDPVHILMDPVNGGGPWTRGPCFVLSRCMHCN